MKYSFCHKLKTKKNSDSLMGIKCMASQIPDTFSELGQQNLLFKFFTNAIMAFQTFQWFVRLQSSCVSSLLSIILC